MNRRVLLAATAGTLIAGPAFALDAGDRTLNALRVGAIVKATPPGDLAKIYGAGRVAEIKVGAEGEEYPGAAILAGTQDELQVAFTADAKRIRFVRVVGRNWKTAEGVRIGTTLGELERINGGPFTFNGFGWDLGGIVHGAKFARSALRVAVGAAKKPPPGEAGAVEGDRRISSRHPALRKMDVRVYLLEVYFSE